MLWEVRRRLEGSSDSEWGGAGVLSSYFSRNVYVSLGAEASCIPLWFVVVTWLTLEVVGVGVGIVLVGLVSGGSV